MFTLRVSYGTLVLVRLCHDDARKALSRHSPLSWEDAGDHKKAGWQGGFQTRVDGVSPRGDGPSSTVSNRVDPTLTPYP